MMFLSNYCISMMDLKEEELLREALLVSSKEEIFSYNSI